jgi:predicted DNA-binding transcriptional regulator AlpA
MTLDPTFEMRWLTVADLAAILRLKPQTIYNRMSICPETLPPATRVPGLRGPRWSARLVREWQAKYDPPDLGETPRHRGRPTKIETIARRAQATGRALINSPKTA